MHSASSSGCAAAALLLLVLLCSAVAGASTKRSVLSYKDEDPTEQPIFSVERTTDTNFVTPADYAASNVTLLSATDSGDGDTEHALKRKLGALSNDMLKFIQDLPEMNTKFEKQWNVPPEKNGSKVTDASLFKFKLQNFLEKCVRKFGAKCARIVSSYESDRRKREAQKSFQQYEGVESVTLGKNFENFFSTHQAKPSNVNTVKEDLAESESVTQYVFRELQNLLYKSRSDLQGESKEVKLVDGYLNKPVQSEYYSDFETVLNPVNTNRDEYRKTTPLLKSTTQPSRQNSVSTPEILLSKFFTSNPKNSLSEFHSLRNAFESTTESGINLVSTTESRYHSTQSTGRYPRSTTSQGSAFQRTEPYHVRTPASVYSTKDVTQGYGDYVVDYITADYETTNPRQTLKELISQSAIRDRLSENVQYEIVNSYPESYDDSDIPLYEYFVISEHSQDEPSYLPSPTYQEDTYSSEKQVYEETRVPVQLVTGNRVSPASSTRFISTTPLSNDELYHIIKDRIPLSTNQPQSFSAEETRKPVQLVTGNSVSPESSTRFISTTPLSNDELYQIIKDRIPLSTNQPQSFSAEDTRVPVQLITGNRVSPTSSTRFISTTPLSNDEIYQIVKDRIPLGTDQPQSFSAEETPVKTLQQEASKLSTESQLTSPSNFETSYSTSSNAFKSSIPEGTTKPLVVNIREPDDYAIQPNLQSESTTYSVFHPEETNRPLVVNIQESDDETILLNLKAEPAQSFETTTTDTTVIDNSYTANNLPTASASMVTKPVTESTTTEQDVGLTTTLQDLITAIENQLGTTAITLEEPIRTDIPMQVTVTSDEITVSGPDTQSISTILYELRQPLLSTQPPFASYFKPHVNSVRPVEVDPMQFAEFTSSVKKPFRKPSITSLFTGDSPFVGSSLATRFQSVPENVYRTSGPVQTEQITHMSNELQIQLSNSYGIPEYLIKSELLEDQLKPQVTATHIFGIPKEIIESELNDDPEEQEEPESMIMTSTTNTAGKESVNLVEQPLVQKLEDDLDDNLPFHGIPLSMLNAELRRALPEEAGSHNLEFERGSSDETEQLPTPTSTFYVVDDLSRSTTPPFLTTKKADGSFLTNFMSIFSQK